MIHIIILSILFLLLPACGAKPKKLVFDRNTHIDCQLADDEYASSQELMHARELAQRYKKNDQEIVESKMPVIASIELAARFEAKLADIPLPLGISPIKQYFQAILQEDTNLMLGYVALQSIDELSQFFKTHMEPYGWRAVSYFAGAEQMLVFEKHDQLCTISLRSHEGWFYQRGYTQIILCVSAH